LSHLTAAAQALDQVSGVQPPDNAKLLRNLALMAEMVQSDIRHSILMFMPDFANIQAYSEHPLGRQAQSRYAPWQGTSCVHTIQETKRLLEVVALLGGQWPHTSFMVPGGVTTSPGASDILKCRMVIEHFLAWYEKQILGCSLQRWQEVQSAQDLEGWLQESSAHQESDLGFLLRFAREAGLDSLGQGPESYLSFGGFPLPGHTEAKGRDGLLIPAGFASGSKLQALDPELISEDISHAWYSQEEAASQPWQSSTSPYASGFAGGKYSWIKSPRYNGRAAETGPLAERVVEQDPLFQDLIQRQGSNVLLRQLARLTRPAGLLPRMQTWLQELQQGLSQPYYERVRSIPDAEGVGLVQAPRGALGHWVRVKEEKIEQYQVITPSTWNGAPRSREDQPGAWEQALLGTPVQDQENPVEIGHVIRSFDPCLVCAVHSLGKNKSQGRAIWRHNLQPRPKLA
jgi:hydrogenase large subunit